MRRAALLLLLPTLVATSPVDADPNRELDDRNEPTQLWNAANDDWFAGRDAAALQRYEALLDAGLDNGALRYNLGTAALRLERYGLAIRHLKLALRAEPDGGLEDDIAKNLALARDALLERDRNRIEKGQLAFDESHGVWVTLFTLLPRSLVLVLALVLSAIFLFSIGILGLRRVSHLHGAARVTAWAAALPFVLVATLAAGRLWADENVRLGVVIRPDALLREAPNPGARGVPVAEGLEVRILDETPDEQGLLEVRIGDERDGWMRTNELGLL